MLKCNDIFEKISNGGNNFISLLGSTTSRKKSSPTSNTEAAHKFRTLHQVYRIHLPPTTRFKPQQHQTEQYCKSPVIYLMVKHGLYISFVNKKKY